MESDVFYGAIKANDHFYSFEPNNELFFSAGIPLYKASSWL